MKNEENPIGPPRSFLSTAAVIGAVDVKATEGWQSFPRAETCLTSLRLLLGVAFFLILLAFFLVFLTFLVGLLL